MRDNIDDFIEIWSKNKEDNEDSISIQYIEKVLQKRSISISSGIQKVLGYNIFLAFTILILSAFNIKGYYGNINLSVILGGMVCITGIVLWLLFRSLRNLKNINEYASSLHQVILKKIRFYLYNFQWLLFILPVLLVFLPLNINMLVDNEAGILKINNPLMNIGVYTMAYIFGLIFYKRKYAIYLKELKTALRDLEENTLTSLEKEQKRNKWFLVIGIIVFTTIVLYGLFVLLFLN